MLKIAIIYPADPMGAIPSGIDTFIRGILRWAPEDLDFSLIGVTTDTKQRPIGRWVRCNLGRGSYRFFAVASLERPGTRGRVPLVLRFLLGMLRYRPYLDADILEFHRLEPSLLYYFDHRNKNAFFHLDMRSLYNTQSDVLWRKLPGLYFWLQDRLVRRLDSAYTVHQSGTEYCQNRYQDIAHRFNFVPTWYDPDIFYPVAEPDRHNVREQWGISQQDELILSVGRLDRQKDPLLLARSFKKILSKRPNAKLWYVGEGPLRPSLEAYIAQESLVNKAFIKGVMAAPELASLLRVANLFVLSSAYVGMPMSVIEALGSGIPVVTTPVGEVALVVVPGVSGEIINDHHEDKLSQAVLNVLANPKRYSAKAITSAVENYVPAKVLTPIYQNYRSLCVTVSSVTVEK